MKKALLMVVTALALLAVLAVPVLAKGPKGERGRSGKAGKPNVGDVSLGSTDDDDGGPPVDKGWRRDGAGKGGKKIVTYFDSTDIAEAIEATFLPTGDGGWQEWQLLPDGTKRHLVFKPTTKREPKGDYWFEWLSHSYPQPDGTIRLGDIFPNGTTWWVNLPPD